MIVEFSWDIGDLWQWWGSFLSAENWVLWACKGIQLDFHGLNPWKEENCLTFLHLFNPLSSIFSNCVCVHVYVCVCLMCASETHLVAGLLVQRDRREIIGSAWLVASETLRLCQERKQYSCDTQSWTRARTHIHDRSDHCTLYLKCCLSHFLGDGSSAISLSIHRCQSWRAGSHFFPAD